MCYHQICKGEGNDMNQINIRAYPLLLLILVIAIALCVMTINLN